MEKINYQKIMEEQIASLGGTPSLLLHSCCGPCSSYVLEVLSQHFNVSVLYYNPNIYPEEEYTKRLAEQKKIIEKMPFKNPVKLMECGYDESEFLNAAQGYENEREGGSRCEKCFILRMKKTALLAKENGFDLMSDGVGYPLYFARKFSNALQSETGPSSMILREIEHMDKIGRYDEILLRDLREQERIRDLIRNGDEIERQKQEKEEAFYRKMEETLDRIEERRRARQENLDSKKLPKAIKKIGKAGIDMDSRIHTAAAMKKIKKEHEK